MKFKVGDKVIHTFRPITYGVVVEVTTDKIWVKYEGDNKPLYSKIYKDGRVEHLVLDTKLTIALL